VNNDHCSVAVAFRCSDAPRQDISSNEIRRCCQLKQLLEIEKMTCFAIQDLRSALTICKFCVLAPLRKHKTLHACHQSSSHTLLQQLHWLCIEYRVNFKIANITFRTLNSFQSTYLRIHCLSCSSVHSLLQVFQHQSALRSIRTHFTRRPQPQCRRP